MQDCDAVQIAIERRLHGDLGVAEAAALDAHLRSCQACQAYQAQARETEAAMNEAVQEMLQGVDWERVRRSAAHHRRFWLEGLVISVAGVAAVAGVSAWFAASRDTLGAALLACGLACAFVGWRTWDRTRGLASEADPAELLAGYRAQIRRDLDRWRRSLWLMPLAFLALPLAVAHDWPDRSALPFLLALGAILSAVTAYELLVRLPRARRTLADLEPRS